MCKEYSTLSLLARCVHVHVYICSRLLDKAVLGICYPCMISYELMGGCDGEYWHWSGDSSQMMTSGWGRLPVECNLMYISPEGAVFIRWAHTCSFCMDTTCTLFPSQREWDKAAVEKMVRKYQTWSGDTGSMPVQSRLTITDYKVVIPALATCSCMCMFSLPLIPCTQLLSFQYEYNISQNTWGTTERYMSSTCYILWNWWWKVQSVTWCKLAILYISFTG